MYHIKLIKPLSFEQHDNLQSNYLRKKVVFDSSWKLFVLRMHWCALSCHARGTSRFSMPCKLMSGIGLETCRQTTSMQTRVILGRHASSSIELCLIWKHVARFFQISRNLHLCGSVLLAIISWKHALLIRYDSMIRSCVYAAEGLYLQHIGSIQKAFFVFLDFACCAFQTPHNGAPVAVLVFQLEWIFMNIHFPDPPPSSFHRSCQHGSCLYPACGCLRCVHLKTMSDWLTLVHLDSFWRTILGWVVSCPNCSPCGWCS